MKRLGYTVAGFLKRVRMSRDGLFVIVEGKVSDPYFYDELCLSSSLVVRSGYQVWRVEQITGSAGKRSSLRLFDYCRRINALTSSNSSSAQSLLFALDRDMDQITGGTRRSRHVLYTHHFDVEAEIFANGHDLRALKSALSLTRSQVRDLIQGLGDWRLGIAAHLRPWITLCSIAEASSVHVRGVGFGHVSRVNGASGTEKEDILSSKCIRTSIEAKALAIAAPKFGTRTLRVESRIKISYDANRGFELVKGKWIAGYLVARAGEILGATINSQGAVLALARAYAVTLDFTAAWADSYRYRMEDLLL